MSTTIAPDLAKRRPRGAIFQRQLGRYPANLARFYYLGLTVLATIALYYQNYAPATVAPSILRQYGMSFSFYVDITVVGFALGAGAAVFAGLADRIGRVNLIAYGLLAVAVLVAFVQPATPSRWWYAAVTAVIAMVEGVVLVATPALVRDFSPQLSRATAMGFWTLGPVLGSLSATAVSSNTLPHLKAWQDQFHIAGGVGLAVSILVLFTLRELPAQLRDQIMVSAHERATIEARAQGIGVEAGVGRPWRQVLTLRIGAAAFAISVFLILYSVLVGFFVVYLELTYGYSAHRANGLAVWYWASTAIALVIFGFASDWLRVRKPFMLVGGIGSLTMTIVFLTRATHASTGYYSLALILVLQAAFMGMAYAPWMASFTEAVEARNPALVAHGLSVYAGVQRIIVAAAVFALPFVVTSVTPLVDNGPQVAALAQRYSGELATVRAIEPTTLTALRRQPHDRSLQLSAVGQITAAEHVSPSVAITQLKALAAVPSSDLAYLAAHGPQVLRARQNNARDWQHWWWVAAGGELVFIPLVFFMLGDWDPRTARRRAQTRTPLDNQAPATVAVAPTSA